MPGKRLIYGCMGLGTNSDTGTVSKGEAVHAEKAILAAYANGITVFDLADIYAGGTAELAFGEVLKRNPGLRENIIIQSKTGICLGAGAGGSNTYNLSKDYIISRTEAILKRIGIEYLDVLLLHRPDPLMNPEHIAKAFADLKSRDLVRAFGVSNMSVSQIEYIEKSRFLPIQVNQLQFSLGHRLLLDFGPDVNTRRSSFFPGTEGLLEHAAMRNMEIQCWGAMDSGKFTGRDIPEMSEAEKHTAELVAKLAEKYQCPKEAIVLAWILRLPYPLSPVIGTTDPDRISKCKVALDIELSREDWYDLWITARGKGLP
ncbi:MAG: aldo/keto reductase family oxidoreductase [Spirochaetia bacterium]